MTASVLIRPHGPFDLPLSLQGAASFLPPTGSIPRSLRLALLIADKPAIVRVRQLSIVPPVIQSSATASIAQYRLAELVEWLTSTDLNLNRFYRIAKLHPLMAQIATRLRGFKPLRPPSLFEAALIAITEQQLSLAAAFHIRTRLFQRFGTPIEDLSVCPTPEALARASLLELMACGLSRRKAEYVKGFSQCVASGKLALETLKREPDNEISQRLLMCRGFGPWTVQYILLRGFGRFNCLPADDVGLRRAAGMHFLHRRAVSPKQLERALEPFAPFRGLAAFYIAVDWRLQQRQAFPDERLTGSAS